MRYFCAFTIGGLLFLSAQVVPLSLRTRTVKLWRRLTPNKLSRFGSSSTAPPGPNEKASSVPFGYSEVFGTQNEATYVPSGLSADEYQRIRQMEAAADAKKDYGAWGPRFAKGSRPDGDWLLLPQLWTSGVPENAQRTAVDANEPTTGTQWFRRWFPAIFLSLLTVEVVLAAVQLTRMGQMTVRQAVWQSLKFLLRRKKTYRTAMLVKVSSSLALVVPMQRGLDLWATRTQCGRFRMLSVSVLGSVLALVAYALLVVGVRHTFL